VIVGGVTSTTVTTATHVLELPAASVAVSVTLLGPNASVAPAAGDCVFVTALQLSVATIEPVRFGSVAVQVGPAFRLEFGAHVVIVGGVTSTTVTTATHVLEFPAASVAVSVTLLAPSANVAPAAGDCVFVTALQLSVAVIAPVRFGRTAVQLGPAFKL
jgi:hypothetical protein